MTTLLLTGFEPFAGAQINASAAVVTQLSGRLIDGTPIIGHILPCTYETAAKQMEECLAALHPDVVVALGQFDGRRSITPERVAINFADAPIPDNADQLRREQVLRTDGPAAYFSRLPVTAIAAAITAQKIPAGVSLTAGTFVCNALFYHLLHALRAQPHVRAGFIHVPLLPEQAAEGVPSMELATMCEGITVAIKTILA